MKVTLKTNGKINPIGISSIKARLSVETDGIEVDSICYSVYKIGKRSNTLLTSFVSKAKAVYITSCLEDCCDYRWTASIINASGAHEERAVFSTGISHENFTAKWVDNPNFDGHVSEIIKNFSIAEKVNKATLYIVGLGMYRSFINDRETDEFCLKPVLTDFSIRRGLKNKHYNESNYDEPNKKTVCYDAFDVTDKIVKGDNKISVLLGTGWYCNEDKDITDPSYTFGKPKLIFELHIETENGSYKILSDEDCLARNTNIKSQLFACDKIDFTAPENAFAPVRLAKAPTGKLVPNPTDNDKVLEELSAVSITNRGKVIEYDFGKNHTGSLRFKAQGARGSKLVVNFYETKKDGVLDPLTSRWDAYKDGEYIIGHLDQTSEYILSGNEDYIEPFFHWSSYRYATVECEGEYTVTDLKSLFITTDIKQDGAFSCSNEFLNRLNETYLLTQRDNMHCGVPSDCPQREKLPYTGDGQITCETVLYAFEAENFYRKWIKDIVNAQGRNGFVPYTAPLIAGGGGMWWSNAIVVVPLTLYKFTGDKTILDDAFKPCIDLIKYYDTKHDGDYINKGSDSSWCLGDWLAPEKPALDKNFVNTLAWYYAITKTLEMAEIIENDGYNEYLLDLKEKVKNAINEKYFDGVNYAEGVQGGNVLPVLLGIAEKNVADKLMSKMAHKYDKDPHFDTGIVLTPRLLDALTLAGRSDVALKVLTEKTGPSYFDMLKGETTLPEHWYKHWPGNPDSYVSHNHPMFGSVLTWVYKNVAGLDLGNLYKDEVVFAPKVIKQVSSARAKKKTIHGVVKVSYVAKKMLMMEVTVPFGIKGTVELPNYVKNVKVDGETISVKHVRKTITFAVKEGVHKIVGEIQA